MTRQRLPWPASIPGIVGSAVDGGATPLAVDTQDTGVTSFSPIVLDVASGDKLWIRVKDVGIAANINSSTPFAVGAQTWLTVTTDE